MALRRTTIAPSLPLLGLLALAAADAPRAQEAPAPDRATEPARVEEVFVPEQAFERVLRRFPRGVMVRQDELRELLRLAGARPAPEAGPREPAPPLPASLERLTITGGVADEVADLAAEAEIAVLSPDAVLQVLPLETLGVRRLLLDGKPALALRTREGAAVLLPGATRREGRLLPGRHTLRWDYALRVEQGEERGAGVLRFPVPAAGSGRLELTLPGDLDVEAKGGVAWVADRQAGQTRVVVAFGGAAASQGELQLSWRPRQALMEVTPFAVGEARSLFLIRPGVVVMTANLRVGVYRAPRDAFQLDLPPGFVVRELSGNVKEMAWVQRGDRLELRLPAPRDGLLEFQLRAELATGTSGGEAEAITLRPLRLPDLDRLAGLVGVAQGDGAQVGFQAQDGLIRTDLGALGNDQAGRGLLRVYEHTNTPGQLELRVAPVEPRVDLALKAAFQLAEREIKALVAYRFEVEEGQVFSLRAELPPGWELDEAAVRDARGRQPQGELRREESGGKTALVMELEQGLRPGAALVLTVQAHRDAPAGLAGTTLDVPSFSGAPASRFSGYLGFAPDEAFRLKSAEVTALRAIPAEELPGVGLEVPGLVLGYRVEDAAYAGKILIDRRRTRVSAVTVLRHRVSEHLIATDAQLDVTVDGAPVDHLELALPAEAERLARLEGPDVRWEDRERTGTLPDGRAVVRVPLERPRAGRLPLRARFETKLPPQSEGPLQLEALPQVSLANAFRERGTVAVHSSGTTELSAEPRGLRAIEVTEVPASPDSDEGYPLFAYTFVGQDWGLGLTVRRHETAAVLTAVAEQLHLQSTADANGTSRHTATFTVKNLNNQFFALRLPAGAVLWSVVVDGEGVKPARRGGVEIVPIPTAGTKAPNEATQVVASYTLPTRPWGALGELALNAPELLLADEQAVPVLQTRWQVALPDDYRLIEVEGNAKGANLGRAPLLVPATWVELRRAHLLWTVPVLALVLLVAASARARAGLLAVTRQAVQGGAAALRAGESAGAGLRALLLSVATAARRRPALVAAGLGGIGLACLALLALTRGGMAPTAMRQLSADYEFAGGAPMPAAAPEGDYDYEERALRKSAAGPEGGDAAPGEDWGDASREDMNEAYGVGGGGGAAPAGGKGRFAPEASSGPMAPGQPAAPPPAPRPQAAAPAPSRRNAPGAERRRGGRAEADSRLGDRDQQEGAELAEAEPMEEALAMDDEAMDAPAEAPAAREPAPADEAKRQLGLLAQDPSGAAGGEHDGTGMTQINPPALDRAEAETLARSKDEKAKELAQAAPAKVVPEVSQALGQVGLRSLVLELPLVGQQVQLSRPGGGAVLAVRLVQERLLTLGCGLAALGAFLLALLLPRRGLISYTGLLVLGLTALTALPLVALGARWIPALNGLAMGLLVAGPVHAGLALMAWWSTSPLSRLRKALKAQPAPAAPAAVGAAARGLAIALALGAGLAAPTPARAQEPAASPQPPQVFVPYDPRDPSRNPERIYVPEEVYLELWKRAYPDAVSTEQPRPVAPFVVTDVRYVGSLSDGRLALEARVGVEVLAEGWQTCPLGLAGTGLEDSQVAGGLPEARVRVAPAGGFELVARGPARYQATLRLVAPRTGSSWAFAAVPTLAAALELDLPADDRRVVVDGARAQREETLPDGKRRRVVASLGGAPRVQLALTSREVITAGGSSEASAATQALGWVRRGRLVLLQETTFSINGAGREGFVFRVPAGLEVTAVETPGIRSWFVSEGQLQVSLRRPSGARQAVSVLAEQATPVLEGAFAFPQLEALGVSRESGVFGLAVDAELRVRAEETALRQVNTRELAALAGSLSRAAGRPLQVERAYGFARRPSPLGLELLAEQVELKCDTTLRAAILSDRTLLQARLAYEVRRGKAYQLAVSVPAEFELAGAPKGLDVREVAREDTGATRTYRLGLASGLAGSASLELNFARPHRMDEELTLALPDLRPLDVDYETTELGVSVQNGLETRVVAEPASLQSSDPRAGANRWGQAAPGSNWVLGYRRGSRGAAGLAEGKLLVRRPRARVSGSWVLHARIERDVVRYTFRALYDIENAGARLFRVQLPGSLGDRYTVEAPNLREYRGPERPGDEQQTVTVELQSPAENFYDLAFVWEEVLTPGQPIAIPQVGLTGVDRQVRGFVLVEKAPQVTDLLQEAGLTGAIERGRVADAPALPPGRGPADFAFAYRVPLKESQPWSVNLKLEAPGSLAQPAPARIPWVHLTSVFNAEGQVRHRALYRVRNLRLQFLALELPKTADVWSVFVAGAPRRLHKEGDVLLVPLPKRTDADLSFDVEVIYATPLPGEFGLGGTLRPEAPRLRTEKVSVERTFWTLYLPEDYDYSGFAELEPTLEVDADVQAALGQLAELRELEELARKGSGSARDLAASNVDQQLDQLGRQLAVCKSNLSEGRDATKRRALEETVAKLERDFGNLRQVIDARRVEERNRLGQQQAQRLGEVEQVQVEGQNFQQMASGWLSNDALITRGNRVQWAGVDADKAPTSATEARKAAEDAWTLSLAEGEKLDLGNVQLYSGSAALEQQARAKGQNRYRQQSDDDLYSQQQVGGQAGAYFGREARPEPSPPAPGNALAGSPRAPGAEGLLSIRVGFATPGRPFHFSTTHSEAGLSFSAFHRRTAESSLKVARGLVLLVLLLGAGRLGLLRRAPGREAARALGLIACGALAVGVFVHPALAGLAFVAGVLGLRRGPLLAA